MPPTLDDDRLRPAEPGQRAIARELLRGIRDLPLVCPHTHIDAWTLAEDRAFTDPVALFVTADHHVLRILMSHEIARLWAHDQTLEVYRLVPR